MTNLSRKKGVQTYFSKETDRWDDVYKKTETLFNYEMQKRKEIVFELIKNNSSIAKKVAIDVGCGAGHYVKDLHDLGYEVIGSDISKQMIEVTKTKFDPNTNSGLKLLCADCENLPFPDNHFDLVICIGVMSYVNDEIKILKELNRIVKPNGNVIVNFPNLIKIRNVLDPYYYLIRFWKYLYKLISNNKREQKTVNDINEYLHNKNFEAQNRYLLKQVNNFVNKSDFKIMDLKGYLYFDFSFFKMQIISSKKLIKFNEFLDDKIKINSYKLFINFPFGWVVKLSPK